MKHLFVALFLLVCTLPGRAQMVTGNKLINGTVNLLIIGNGDDTQTAFTLSPTLGYFVNDQTVVGGILGIVRQSFGNTDNNLTVFLSPFVRRYLPIVDNTFYFFIDGSVSFSYGQSAAGVGEFYSSEDAFSIGLAASPGFAYFPTERWSLDFTFTGFGLTFFDLGGERATTLFNLGATTLSPNLGFSYYF